MKITLNWTGIFVIVPCYEGIILCTSTDTYTSILIRDDIAPKIWFISARIVPKHANVTIRYWKFSNTEQLSKEKNKALESFFKKDNSRNKGSSHFRVEIMNYESLPSVVLNQLQWPRALFSYLLLVQYYLTYWIWAGTVSKTFLGQCFHLSEGVSKDFADRKQQLILIVSVVRRIRMLTSGSENSIFRWLP